MTDDGEYTTVPWVDIQLNLPVAGSKLNRKTPLETKGIRSVTVELEDGAVLEFDLLEEKMGGFYRSNELVRNGIKVIQHEVYITDGNS